jgi:2-keto-4-pentenoate hydratase/2-oxohepta-3-ene-1,7-dioic acid hydratase in catechol pathway
MKLVSFDDYRTGVVTEGGVVDVTSVVPELPRSLKPMRMLVLIEEWDTLRPQVEKLAASGRGVALDSVRLLAPVPAPRKVYAAPANYAAHSAEMEGSQWGGQHHSGDYGMFLKAASSVSGPSDTVLLPYGPNRVNHHESELVAVIGRGGSDIPVGEALGRVFGYTCGLDITVRGPEDRSKRKSFDTFSPTGPWIVTADEVPDPAALEIKLWVNEELRQHCFTKDMITDTPNLISNMSWVTRMEPGDLLFTGTPDGVGPLVDGDLVTINISGVGELSVRVADRPVIGSR